MTAQTILITGAAGGLGQAMATRLRADGHTIIETDVAGSEVELDVTDIGSCRAVATVYQPDVWINNAGVLNPGMALLQPDSDIGQILNVTLRGTINGTRAAAEAMADRGGHIINIASLGAFIPVPGEAVYAAAKSAVLSFSLGCLAEMRLNDDDAIDISVVCPDGMLTPMITPHLDNPEVALSFSGRRTVEPEEVAGRVAELITKPKPVTSIPRWRGGLLRGLAVSPASSLRLAKPIRALSLRNQRRAAKKR